MTNNETFKTAREILSSGAYRTKPDRSKSNRGSSVRAQPYKRPSNRGNLKDLFNKYKSKDAKDDESGESDSLSLLESGTNGANHVGNSSNGHSGGKCSTFSNGYDEKLVVQAKKPTAALPFRPPFKRLPEPPPKNPPKTYGGDEDDKNLVNANEVREIMEDPRAKNLDPKIVDRILNEIIEKGKSVDWSDIAGLDFAKTNIREIVILPMLRPNLFKGLRAPSKGLLLFGPPGTGKTMIGKCIASQSKSTFFSISASSLTSKWIGEGEKLVRTLFSVARIRAPSVIFIDEIDSLLTQRNDTEHESSRRMKTEFLVQFDGLNTEAEERLLVVGATNRPHELDEAARRRFSKRLYIPLPDEKARITLLQQLLLNEKHTLTSEDFEHLCSLTDGYSGADIKNLCGDAALGPIRKIDFSLEEFDTTESLPPITYDDFVSALDSVKASVAEKDLEIYKDWNEKYGSVRHKLGP